MKPTDRVPTRRSARSDAALRSTVPIVLASAMTVALGVTGPIDAATAAPTRTPHRPASRPPATPKPVALAAIARATLPAPESYTVVAGDTISGIAERFGLSTPAVLASNGLSWRSLIHPGQVLRLSAAPAAAAAPTAPQPTAPLAATSYTIQRGDTVSAIAGRFGVPTAQLLAANGLGWSSVIYPGQRLTVPGGIPAAPAAAVTPAPAATPVRAAPSATAPYTIRRGDTVSSVAAAAGTSVDAVLAANGLTRASIIYAGRVLQLPVATTDAGTPAPSPAGLTAEQAGNARTIVQIGRSLGVPERGLIIALAAAAQESGLRNLPSGDRDSVGLFQQRPSTGWGTPAQLQDPGYAARLFFGGPSNPNAGRTRGLLDVSGWQGLTVTQAAQAVQISAFPVRYAQWEAPAAGWLAQLG